MTVRILVTGPRQWTDLEALQKGLDHVSGYGAWQYHGLVVLAHGGASGFDQMAAREASGRGWDVAEYKAVWGPAGAARDFLAGFKRNQRMVEDGPWDACLIGIMPCVKLSCSTPRPHASHGTMDCAGRALLAEIPVHFVRPS